MTTLVTTLYTGQTREINRALLLKYLSYNPETGSLVWLARSRTEFGSDQAHKAWNTRFAGTTAGRICQNGYRSVRFGKKSFLAHRLIWLMVHGAQPPAMLDHINGIRSDNRLCNLREVSRAENGRNAKLASNNTSGVVGVSWVNRDSRWVAAIKTNGITKQLGRFKKFADAVAARKSAESAFGFHPNHGRS